MQLNLRRVLIGLIALVAIGGIWSALASGSNRAKPVPSSSAETQSTQGISGTMVIDFGERSDREVIVRDYTDVPTEKSSWDLFAASALKVEGTSNYPTGFVCRIEGWPSVQKQDCIDTPTYAEGTWAYFVTNPSLGDGWVMSGQGASMHKPVCGGYEAWVWIEGGSGDSKRLPNYTPTPRSCQ